MVKKYKRQLGSRKYKDYSEDAIKEAIQKVKNEEMLMNAASKTYKIPIGTLSNKLRGLHEKKVGHPYVFREEEEAAFVAQILEVSRWGFPFNLYDLRVLAKTYLDHIGKTVSNFVNNFPSYEWAKTFFDRHKEKLTLRQCQNIKASRAKLSAEDVSEYFERMKETLTKPDGSEIPPSNLFNFDETNLSDNLGTKKCLFKRGIKYPERVKDSTKASISIMFCGSADGCMLPAYVVYKAEHIWSTWTEGGPIGVRYSRSKSG